MNTDKRDLVTVTVERGPDCELRVAATSAVSTIKSLSCTPGEWFESVLMELCSRLDAEEKCKTSESVAAKEK